jgi:hypothetical protein
VASIKAGQCNSRWRKLFLAYTGNGTGKGIFAKVDFKKGDLIFTWRGVRKKGKKVKYPYIGRTWLTVGEFEWLAPPRNSPGWYINHSCNPNAGIRGSIHVVAMQDIYAGEEITMDYSTTESDEDWHLICHCESKNCRGIIRSYEFLPPELKQKYRAFTSEYLLIDNGIECPKCDSRKGIVVLTPRIDEATGERYGQDVDCKKCGYHWVEFWKLYTRRAFKEMTCTNCHARIQKCRIFYRFDAGDYYITSCCKACFRREYNQYLARDCPASSAVA